MNDFEENCNKNFKLIHQNLYDTYPNDFKNFKEILTYLYEHSKNYLEKIEMYGEKYFDDETQNKFIELLRKAIISTKILKQNTPINADTQYELDKKRLERYKELANFVEAKALLIDKKYLKIYCDTVLVHDKNKCSYSEIAFNVGKECLAGIRKLENELGKKLSEYLKAPYEIIVVRKSKKSNINKYLRDADNLELSRIVNLITVALNTNDSYMWLRSYEVKCLTVEENEEEGTEFYFVPLEFDKEFREEITPRLMK